MVSPRTGADRDPSTRCPFVWFMAFLSGAPLNQRQMFLMGPRWWDKFRSFQSFCRALQQNSTHQANFQLRWCQLQGFKRRRAIHPRTPEWWSQTHISWPGLWHRSPLAARRSSKERCMQLHGPARSVDLYAIKKQLRALEGPGTRASLNQRATGLPTVPSRSAQSQLGQIKVQDIYCSPSSDSLGRFKGLSMTQVSFLG